MEHNTLEIDRDELLGNDVTSEIRDIVETVKDKQLLQRYYSENPYVVLAAAVGVGYMIGGGTFSPFSRRVARIGMKALLLPLAASQLKNISDKDI